MCCSVHVQVLLFVHMASSPNLSIQSVSICPALNTRHGKWREGKKVWCFFLEKRCQSRSKSGVGLSFEITPNSAHPRLLACEFLLWFCPGPRDLCEDGSSRDELSIRRRMKHVTGSGPSWLARGHTVHPIRDSSFSLSSGLVMVRG